MPYPIAAIRGHSVVASSLVAPAPFSPSDIAGLVWWLKADAGTYQGSTGTVAAVADGDPVGKWVDQSSGTHDALQVTLNKRPVIKLNIQNGLPVIRFVSASSQELGTASIATTYAAITVYLIVKGANTTQGYALTFATSAFALIHNYTAGKWEWYSTPRTVIGDTSTSVFQGISTTVGSMGAGGIWSVNAANGNFYSDEDIGEILVYNSVLSAGNNTKVKDYLIARWNVAAF